MINKKIALSALTIVISLSLMAGATYAFFTDSAQSSNNAMTAGTLDITVDQSAEIFENSLPITNWQPAEERFVRFDVVNGGSLPVNLRAFALGEWDIPALDENLVKVVLVEYWDGSGWADLVGNGVDPITGVVYFSSDGTETGTMVPVASGDTQEFRLTVELDGTANNDYQGRTFNSNITVHAKQTTPGAEWPTL